MANDGIIVLIANINQNKELVGNVTITSRGFILVNENEELINKISNCASESIRKHIKKTKDIATTPVAGSRQLVAKNRTPADLSASALFLYLERK